MEAREEAAVVDDPGEECSARMVVRCAMQELLKNEVRLLHASIQIVVRLPGHSLEQGAR